MTAPVDTARFATNVTAGISPWPINVGSPAAGTLLIVFVRVGSADTPTFTGYTVLFGPDSSDATDDITVVYYRWADGSEGATDPLTVGTGTSKGCAICWQITGAENPAVTAPVVSTPVVGTVTANTADPGTAAGSSADCLYLAMAAGDGEVGAYTAAPSGYSNLVTANSGTGSIPASNVLMGGASKQATASASDNPGAFTHAAHNAGWTAVTVRVTEPASAIPDPAAVDWVPIWTMPV